MIANTYTGTVSFKQYILDQIQEKRSLLLLAIAFVLELIIFKILYPYPNFMPPDSNSYLEAAFNNQFINLWPIGYSKFLRLFSSFTSSHLILIIFQYILLYASILYFVFTVHYLLNWQQTVISLFIFILVLGPLLLHVSNFVSSDALFTSVSLIWLGQLLWLFRNPGWKLIIFHGIVLLVAFATRFNALYYPIISITVILITRLPVKKKIMAISIIIIPISFFVAKTLYEYRKVSGIVQFSAFGGWQIASNSLYGYAHATPDPTTAFPGKFSGLHNLVNAHMDSIRLIPARPDAEVGIYYLWNNKAPLKSYLNIHPHLLQLKDPFLRFAALAPLYSEYGSLLIKKHPVSFIKYYLWPNLLKYYSPSVGFLGEYNIQETTVAPIVADWFGWKNNQVHTLFNNKEIKIAKAYSVLFALANIAFICCMIAFLVLPALTKLLPNKTVVILLSAVWFINAGFIVFAAPIELRYLIFQLILATVLASFSISFIQKNYK